MICPNCQTVNPDGARYCLYCGYSFEPAGNCPNCGAAVLPGARFCHQCGRPLAAAASPPVPDLLHKFIPRELLTRLQSAGYGREMEGERRIVTMLFCDVKGSTAMAESLDPEDWAEIMNGAFEYLIPPVFRYEGMIPRMMGDAVLAFFGAPIAHEDDPERAVRAGLEMVEGIGEYREKIQRERGLDFNVRVGINTGLVVVGQVGTDLRMEYTAMGDAINLAARMEQTARPGTVQITEHTYRLVAPFFHVEPLGGIEVKGKSEPVEAYRVVGIQPDPDRLFGPAGLDVPLVGREQEMRALRQNLEEVHRGRGGIVFLIGETGLGKSRLIDELRRDREQSAPTGAPVEWSLLRSTSFAASRPYGQFRQHLLEQFGIRETDPPETVRRKIGDLFARRLPELGPRAISVYGRLLGVAEPGVSRHGEFPGHLVDASPLESEGFKRDLFDLVLAFERAWIGDRAAVHVFDDLHWIDPASAELLISLLKLTRETSVLFIGAFRPDPGTPAWEVRRAAEKIYGDRYTEIRLRPLSSAETLRLAGQLIAGADQYPQVLEQILGKTEGNPLFVEEVVWELLARGDLDRGPEGLRWSTGRDPAQIAIPDSLHALLLARLDRLEDDARRTLQLASVIGRSFYYRVLRRIIEASIKLDRELQQLQRTDLIHETARQPELEYEFRHPLTQEAAYHSILIKRRREYHRRVGEALEEVFSDRLEDQAEVLAYHFDIAGDIRARKYYRLAGKKAAQIYAREAAVDYYTRALEVAGSPPAEEQLSIYEARADINYSLGRFEQATADFEAARSLARQAEDPGGEVRIIVKMVWLLWSRGMGAEALELAREAERRSAAIGDREQALFADIALGTALANVGDMAGARDKMRQALFASRRQPHRRLTALNLYFLAMHENFTGRFARAAVCALRAHEVYLDLGDRAMAAGSLFNASLAEGGMGRYDRALAVLKQGRSLAEEASSLWLTRYPNQRAWLSAELGDWETAYAYDLDGLHPAQDVPGYREIEISTLINLVLDCTALGRLDEAEEFLLQAEQDVGRPEFGSHNWRWRIRLADARAGLHLRRGDLEPAAASTEALLDQAEQMEARKYIARGLAQRGRIHLEMEDTATAEADLLSAVRLADSLCYPPTRIEARRQLTRLYMKRGAAEAAGRFQQEAANLVAELDAQIHHPEMRLSFQRGLRNAFNGSP